MANKQTYTGDTRFTLESRYRTSGRFGSAVMQSSTMPCVCSRYRAIGLTMSFPPNPRSQRVIREERGEPSAERVTRWRPPGAKNMSLKRPHWVIPYFSCSSRDTRDGRNRMQVGFAAPLLCFSRREANLRGESAMCSRTGSVAFSRGNKDAGTEYLTMTERTALIHTVRNFVKLEKVLQV